MRSRSIGSGKTCSTIRWAIIAAIRSKSAASLRSSATTCPWSKRSSCALIPAIQCCRSRASVFFGGALPETIPVTSANSVRQRRRSRCGLALRLSCQCAQNFFRQEMHQRCPLEQARVAVQPVARRLIAASDGIDEVERCVTANEVTGGKPVGFDSNR
jgi:hypothetical protein